MKFNIPTEEVKNILEMHAKMKKNSSVISEQVTGQTEDPILTKLRDAVKAGCLKNGSLKRSKSTGRYYYRKPSVKNPSLLVDFFGDDMTYKSADGSISGKWKCDEIAQNAQQQVVNAADIALIKKEGGWQEAKDINTTRENLENPKMFEKKVVNGVTLYRSVISKGVTGGLTPEQIKVIEKYTKLGGKLRKDLDAEEAQTWSSKVVYPAGTLFAEDLVMFFPPSNVVGADGGNIEQQFNKAISNQTPTSKKDCRDTIEAYYEAWRTKKRPEQHLLLPMKEKVQACVNQFEGKWGGVLSRIDDYVDILRGDKEGGPLSDSKWRIE